MEERANRYTTMLVLVAADLLPHRWEQLQLIWTPVKSNVDTLRDASFDPSVIFISLGFRLWWTYRI